MDGIITIVVIAIAIIFKVIDKRLKKAAADEVFPSITTDPDLMKIEQIVDEDEEPAVIYQVFEEAQKALPSEPQESAKVADPVRKKEKIDLKKMIVYSEIMKPKYLE